MELYVIATAIVAVILIFFFMLIIVIIYERNRCECEMDNSFSELVKKPLFVIKKTPCFGHCPVYKATIYNDSSILFEGERNVPVLGEKIMMDDKLKNKIVNFKYQDYKNKYDNEDIMDVPTTIITFYKNNPKSQNTFIDKEIIVRFNAPTKLNQFIEMIHQQIIDNLDK